MSDLSETKISELIRNKLTLPDQAKVIPLSVTQQMEGESMGPLKITGKIYVDDIDMDFQATFPPYALLNE